MQTLELDAVTPLLLPADVPICIALVGCGGTGSHLALALARLASHVAQTAGAPQLSLCFIDGDTVDARNVGRQLFSPAEVGLSKAVTLADRLNTALGLRIAAIPEMATVDLLNHTPVVPPAAAIGVLVGAVDGVEGRQALHAALTAGRWRFWLDCGNHEASGQVAVGTTTTRMRSLVATGLATHVPAPSLQFPELLRTVPRRQHDCAAAMIDNAQSLMVNQMMAAIASEYVYDLVVRRRLDRMQTVVDLRSLTMRSTRITERTLASFATKKARKQAA